MKGVAAYGRAPECRATFRSDGPHITYYDPNIGHIYWNKKV